MEGVVDSGCLFWRVWVEVRSLSGLLLLVAWGRATRRCAQSLHIAREERRLMRDEEGGMVVYCPCIVRSNVGRPEACWCLGIFEVRGVIGHLEEICRQNLGQVVDSECNESYSRPEPCLLNHSLHASCA